MPFLCDNLYKLMASPFAMNSGSTIQDLFHPFDLPILWNVSLWINSKLYSFLQQFCNSSSISLLSAVERDSFKKWELVSLNGKSHIILKNQEFFNGNSKYSVHLLNQIAETSNDCHFFLSFLFI